MLGVWGCSGAEGADALVDADATSDETVASTSEALNASSCIGSGVSPNRVLNNVWGLGQASSPDASYGQPGCDAYLVEVRDYLDHPSVNYWNYANAAGAPLTQNQCARTRIRVYVWEKEGNGPFTFFANDSRWGSWVGGRCVTYLNLKNIGDALSSGATVRYAMKAQLHDVAGDGSSPHTNLRVMVQEDSAAVPPLPPR